MSALPIPTPLPQTGSIFVDSRGGGRAMRLSWHHDAGLVVLSLWRENVCAGSFRLGVDEVPELIEALRSGLDTAYSLAAGHRAHERAAAGDLSGDLSGAS
ncbi:hypothetical protein BJ980_002433 [Nocardioides daedukensis]|uniref:Uncharacterized protein n=1 Tax=Nocardioides daedukensis TaxID=634462 RepID=A0A7Y9S4Y9_9ACTN|nr:hypothetical protein [Nocardioides daedukensis]NYG59510.1 hypothetical protein [Nocardioides daedukensis]